MYCVLPIFVLLQISATSGQEVSAVAEIFGAMRQERQPSRRSFGFITITQPSNNRITLTGMLTNLPQRIRGMSVGFHIHQNGDLRNACAAAGPHYNPFGQTHGGPNTPIRHGGDLGNINVDNQGNAAIQITVANVSLTGPNSVIGRALVIHAMTDDLGRGMSPQSSMTGNAGARLACGVIGLVDMTPPCRDRRQDCAQLIGQCRDPQQVRQMIQDCRSTCGFCDCRDEDSRCPQLTAWCDIPYAPNVRNMCRLTCRQCACVDEATDCFQNVVFCYNDVVRSRCRQTCKAC